MMTAVLQRGFQSCLGLGMSCICIKQPVIDNVSLFNVYKRFLKFLSRFYVFQCSLFLFERFHVYLSDNRCCGNVAENRE